MQTSKFSCTIENSDPQCALGMEIWLDQQRIFNQDHVTDSVDFSHDFLDDEADHELRFVLKNKLPQHTKVDANNEIIQDAVIKITDISFDELTLGNMIPENMIYFHDYNGNGPSVQDKFYNYMGCNGTASLKFTTPIYQWLLEKM